ncbi:fumarylacetoacetate hydrolase family protein [Streptomyces sp. NPDC050287]|uniref:fumarylacetoacetate hydrolase family protein n=1 Tax=Streptomyces sp. NPDC050287 TaxID=3365608 RepID=UPI00379B21E5
MIGRPGRDIPRERALDHIADYTILCDWSARDLQLRELPLGAGPAKSMDGAITLGPLLVTPDEIESRRSGKGFALVMTAALNGKHVSEGRWDSIDWDFADMIAYTSRGTELRPCDVIGSGTVPTGCLFEHYATSPETFTGWLQPGDEVRLSIEGLGQTAGASWPDRTSSRSAPGSEPDPAHNPQHKGAQHHDNDNHRCRRHRRFRTDLSRERHRLGALLRPPRSHEAQVPPRQGGAA